MFFTIDEIVRFEPLRPDYVRAWEEQYTAIVHPNPWLVKKLDRGRRAREHADYITTHVPELLCDAPGIVADIGCGDGMLLDIARKHGHTCYGVDAAHGAGGMGDAYLGACKLIQERQRHVIMRSGFEAWKFHAFLLMESNSHALINFRGSFEQSMSRWMVGEPHDQHHDSKQLAWGLEEWNEVLFAFGGPFDELFIVASRLLRQGGSLLIAFNESKNQAEFEQRFDEWFAGHNLLPHIYARQEWARVRKYTRK